MKHFLNHYTPLWEYVYDTRLEEWKNILPKVIHPILQEDTNGNMARWLPAINAIFELTPAKKTDINTSAITATELNLTQDESQKLQSDLKVLMPWRKGPFQIENIYMDTEWHSDWKWDRIKPHLANLNNRKVLDIGCGSGYHLWRMLGEGAQLAVGVDPSLLSMSQFLVIKHLLGNKHPAYFLPLTLEQLPVINKGDEFDTVFSMGVLYHRKSPIDHILDLKKHLQPNGELVLETLVIPENYGQILVPNDRYAQMNNVWFLPSVNELIHWIEKCGFKNVRCVDLDQTSTKEQRTTEWMQWNSLEKFLDPNDHSKTVEGYPAPLRAVILANK